MSCVSLLDELRERKREKRGKEGNLGDGFSLAEHPALLASTRLAACTEADFSSEGKPQRALGIRNRLRGWELRYLILHPGRYPILHPGRALSQQFSGSGDAPRPLLSPCPRPVPTSCPALLCALPQHCSRPSSALREGFLNDSALNSRSTSCSGDRAGMGKALLCPLGLR